MPFPAVLPGWQAAPTAGCTGSTSPRASSKRSGGGDGFFYGDLRAGPAGLLAACGGEDGDELILVDHGGERVQVLTASAGFLAGPQLRGQRP